MNAPRTLAVSAPPRIPPRFSPPGIFFPRTSARWTPARRPFASRTPENGKPIGLDPPAKFVPPSHGSGRSTWRLPRVYGARFTEAEIKEQNTKHYPGIMAPEGTWEHWFFHNRAVHVFISLGTLAVLAIGTFYMNFTTNSPYRHMVPEFDSLLSDPAGFFSSWRRAIALHDADRDQKVNEMRQRHLAEFEKRQEYMRAHGLRQNTLVGRLSRAAVASETENSKPDKET